MGTFPPCAVWARRFPGRFAPGSWPPCCKTRGRRSCCWRRRESFVPPFALRNVRSCRAPVFPGTGRCWRQSSGLCRPHRERATDRCFSRPRHSGEAAGDFRFWSFGFHLCRQIPEKKGENRYNSTKTIQYVFALAPSTDSLSAGRAFLRREVLVIPHFPSYTRFVSSQLHPEEGLSFTQ